MVWGQAEFFSAPPLARNSRFALALLSPLFARNTQKITPVLQAKLHAILDFPAGIICGPHRESFAVRDHLRFGDHLRFTLGIISGLGSFAVGDHLRRCTVLYCSLIPLRFCRLSFAQSRKDLNSQNFPPF